MTVYLTKIEAGKTRHFRATPDPNGVSIVHGIFYQWMGKYFEGCRIQSAHRTEEIEAIRMMR